MSSITPRYRTIQELLQSQSFSIDEYQREYKWQKENINELLFDLLEKFLGSYKNGDSTTKVSGYEEYFLGSIIISKRNGKNYLIDGQQRVTSLTLLLIYLYRSGKNQSLPIVQTLAPLIYSDSLGAQRFNLDIPERLPVIEALFNGAEFSASGKDESIQTMYARYKDISEFELVAELGGALPHFAYWLLTRVGLIEIATDVDAYAYAIFETMNDRGKPLSPVDMLKAYLLAPVANVEQRRIANEVWKKQVLDLNTWGGDASQDRDATCIKAWLRAQHADTIRERKAGATDKDWELIGTAFHRWVRDNRNRLQLGVPAGNLSFMMTDFPFFARAYQRVLEASSTYRKGSEAVFYNAHNDFTWQGTVVLASLSSHDDDETVRRKIGATATFLDIWLMRRTVNYKRVGYSAVSYAMWLLCRDIRGKELADLVSTLTDRLASDEMSFAGNAAEGRLGVGDLRINQFSRRYIFHLLARLTAFTEAGAGGGEHFEHYVDRGVKNPFDIEHIWSSNLEHNSAIFVTPQEFQEWRDHVGSLVLLPADVNRSLQDKPFDYKVTKYASQNFYAASLSAGPYKHQPQFEQFRTKFTLPFQACASFGKAEQQNRRQLVQRLVDQIWSPARLQEFLP